MKKTLNVFALLFVITIGLFTSCTQDTIPPVITISSPTSDTTTVLIGGSLDFVLSMTSENGLTSLHTLSSASGVTITKGDVTFANTSSESATVNVAITSDVTAGTVVELTFTVNDYKSTTTITKHILVKAAPLVTSNSEWEPLVQQPVLVWINLV